MHPAGRSFQDDRGLRLHGGHLPGGHQGGRHTDGTMAAHAEIAHVIGEHDAGICTLSLHRQEKGEHQRIVPTGFIDQGRAQVVVITAQALQALHHGGAFERGQPTGQDPGGLTFGVGVDPVQQGKVVAHGDHCVASQLSLSYAVWDPAD
jgi:hypothetical protein